MKKITPVFAILIVFILAFSVIPAAAQSTAVITDSTSIALSAITLAPTYTQTTMPTSTLTALPSPTLTWTPSLSPSFTPSMTPSMTLTPTLTSTPTLTRTLPGPVSDIFTFANLGQVDQVMNGPYDYTQVRFSLPNNWMLSAGGVLQLHLNNTFSNLSGLTTNELIQATGATLDIGVNDNWVTTVILDWNGDKTISIPISASTLAAVTDGQYYIYMSLDASLDCQIDHQSTIVVLSDSALYLPHKMITPTIDLVKFPDPLYQANTINPSNIAASSSTAVTTSVVTAATAIIVTPDNPDAAEMKSALIVSAGLGRLTEGNLPVNTIPVSKLTDQMKKTSHLVFVGKGTGFTPLNGLQLPATYDGKSFKTPKATVDDGLIQEIVSPWDTSKVVLIISGENDSGILKAAQAISSGVIMVSDKKDIAVVTNVVPGRDVSSVTDDRTLADLKYQSIQLTGIGIRTFDFMFFVPAGQILREAAYFKVMFTNSPFLDVSQSALSVLLNGQPIGGVRFTNETSKSMTSEQITIPGDLLRAGMNKLTVEVDHIPTDYCSGIVTDNLWTSISNQSLLHIPLTQAASTNIKQTSLANYTDFLSTSPTLNTTGFVVAQNSPDSIKIASQIAYQLGSLMTGEVVELKAAYANDVPVEFRKDHELVLVGRASQLPIIEELGTNLPAPFEKGSDVAQETVLKVIYRIPANISVGYLELLSAPWDPAHNILAVLGSTEEGLTFSANALTVPAIQVKLAGNYAVVRNEQVITGDTRMGVGTGSISSTLAPGAAVITQIPTDVPTPISPSDLPFANRTNWIIPVVIGSSIFGLLILVLVYLASRRNR
jgi:cellulose synthase operon protein B